jgi:DNA-binding CsgD family transcriptional regulator
MESSAARIGPGGYASSVTPLALAAGTATRSRAGWARSAPSQGEALAWRLDRLNKFLLAASPVARVTSGIAREACRALGFTRVAYLHANLNMRRIRGRAGYGIDPALLRGVAEPFESSPWIMACMANGRPGFTLSAAHGPVLPIEYVELFKLGPLLCVPVIDSSGPVAVMLFDRRGAPFGVSEEMLSAAASVGKSLGLALEAARSYGSSATGGEPAPLLSKRQRQMLSLLSRGLSNKEMATATGLSVFTVRDYVSSLLRRFDVDSRSAAVARGWELGLLGFDQG